MAVTITQNPQLYTPSDNPVVWVFSSDQTAQANFYFLVEVYISGNLVEVHKVYPENGNYAHFNAQSITERYASVIDANIELLGNNSNNNVSTYIKVIEYYGTTPTEQANATSTTINVFKARLKRKDFVNYDYLDYTAITKGDAPNYLTLFPSNEKYKCGLINNVYMSIINNSIQYDFMDINTYDSSGVLVQNFNYSVNLLTSKISSYDVSPSSISGLIPTLDFTGVDYYEVILNDGVFFEKPFRVYLDNDCTYSTSKRLHFLNSLGGIDSFTFGLIGRENTSIESFGYERQFGGFNGSNDWDFSLNDGTVVDYLKKFNNTLELTSDWLTQDVQNWLSSELYTSPVVWVEDDGELNRVKVTNKGYDKKIQENDMLFQEVVSIELENDYSVNV